MMSKRYTCPRCDKINVVASHKLGLFRCECGLDTPARVSGIKLGKYDITFKRAYLIDNEGSTDIQWGEPIRKQELDYDATQLAVEAALGKDWVANWSATGIAPNINQYRVYKTVDAVELRTITIPSLRFKISLEEIERLMLLR